MPLIHGKQLRLNTLKEELLLVTGATATSGQLLAYDAGSGGFSWVNNTGGVTSITAGGGLSGNTTTGDVTLAANVDSSSIFLNGSNQISLGNPTTGDIGFGTSNTYRFVGGSNHVIVEGDFTVNGTSTFINTTNLAVSDNIIIINSGSTVGFGTAGISVDLGNGSFSDILWHEANGGYWAIDNPDGSGATVTYPILTTDSIETGSTAVSITQGTGVNIDKITIDVVEENFSNIPNSALQNSSFTVTDDNVVTGSTPVSLGGTLDIGLVQNSITEIYLNTTNSPTDNYVLSYDQGSGGFTWVDGDGADTFATGGTVNVTPTDNSETGSIRITGNDGFTPFTITGVNNTYTTGTTVNSGTGIVTFYRNDGVQYTVDLSSLDFNDTFSTGTTNSQSATNNSNTQTTDITGNAGFVDFTVSFTDTFTTGGTLSGNNIVLNQNDGSNISIDISGSDFNDTYVTGNTLTTATDNTNSATINLKYNQDVADGTYTLSVEDTFVTGGTYNNGTGDLTLTRNDSSQIVVDLSSITASDTYVTGGTYSNGTGLITFDGVNSFPQFTVDLSSMDQNDTFSTDGSTTTTATDNDNAQAITINGNTGFSSFVVSGLTDTYVTGATIDNSTGTLTLEYNGHADVAVSGTFFGTVPYTLDKELTVTATTAGNNSDTGIPIAVTPDNDGYVGVSINGVWYIVGDGVTTKDCYFSSNGTAGGVRTIENIVAGDKLVWNGTISGFEVDSSDNVAFYYNILK